MSCRSSPVGVRHFARHPASEPAGVVGTRRNRQRAGTNRRQPIPTQAGIRSLLITAHWTIDHDAIVGLPAPRSWNNGIEADLDYDDASLAAEAEVVEAIAHGAVSEADAF